MSYELLIKKIKLCMEDERFLELVKKSGYVFITKEEYEDAIADAWSEGLIEGMSVWCNDNDEEW